MAIQRNAQAPQFQVQAQVGAAPSAVGFVSPDVAKFQNNDTSQGNVGGSTLDMLVSTLIKPVATLAQKELNTAHEEAYMRGQAAAVSGQAQNSVDSNIFTKDWATAGYRDTRGMLALADAEAQTNVDMQVQREKSPQEYLSYIENRRAGLMGSMEGMSLEARKGFMAQLLTSDRSAIARHATEHQKFIVDNITTSVSTQMSGRLNDLDKARTSPEAYLAATDNAFGALFGTVWQNPSLPKEIRTKLTTEAAATALVRNHEALYERMRDVKLGDGSTMLSNLPFDDQVKLAKAYEGSQKDTAAMRLGSYHEQLGLMEATFGDPTAPMLSHDDFKAMLDQGVQLKALSAEKVESLTKAWAEGTRKKQQAADLAGAYAAGDVNKVFAMGHDESDAYKAFIQSSARSGATAAQTVSRLLQIGQNTGQQSAFKGVGELTRSAISSIGMNGTIDPGQAQMVNTVLATIDKAEAGANPGAMSSFLSSFSDDERAKIMLYREGLQKGKAPSVAAADAADALLKQSQLSASDRNVLAMGHADATKKLLAEITPRDLWGTIKNSMPDLFRFKDNINRDRIVNGKSWFENGERVQEHLMGAKVAIMEEANYVDREHPLMGDDARRTLILSRVADRTLQLKDGPFQIPRLLKGQTVQDFFGVNAAVGKDVIASALSDLHVAKPGNQTVYKMTGAGQIKWQEFGPDNELVNPGGTFDPKSVSQAIQDKFDAQTEKFQRQEGRGVFHKGPDGSQVNYNGNNTTGIPTDVMLGFRDNLVKNEGVRATPYDDASGKVVNGARVQTAGVGVSSHSPFYPKDIKDGKLTQQQINESFTLASNDAAKKGQAYQFNVGLQDSKAAFNLLSEMTYQGGSVDSGFLSALRSRDKEKATTELRATPQYKMAHDARKRQYETMLNDALTISIPTTIRR